MADLSVIKYDRNGDPDYGLHDWGAYPPEMLRSGEPLQKGHTYLDTASSIFSSGVWDCTAHELLPGPYDVDEFMLVLEGSIIIEHESGHSDRFSAGESFIIPKGTPCSWKQDEYTRKFWAIHDDPEIPLQADAALSAIRVDPNAELPIVSGHDPAMYESEVPDMGLLALYRDPSGRFLAGLWDCSPMKRRRGLQLQRRGYLHGAGRHGLPVAERRIREKNILQLHALVTARKSEVRAG
jgi:uncharacterized cupin superfamily protein